MIAQGQPDDRPPPLLQARLNSRHLTLLIIILNNKCVNNNNNIFVSDRRSAMDSILTLPFIYGFAINALVPRTTGPRRAALSGASPGTRIGRTAPAERYATVDVRRIRRAGREPATATYWGGCCPRSRAFARTVRSSRLDGQSTTVRFPRHAGQGYRFRDGQREKIGRSVATVQGLLQRTCRPV